jgi:hypothetical protein
MNGGEISPATAKELFDRKNLSAYRSYSPAYIYDDQSSQGEFSLYPLPPENQNVKNITIDGFNGEVIDESYGVYLDNDFGTTLTITSFDFAGSIFYKKVGAFEKVKDYNAVVFYALFLAYNSDADMANPSVARLWYEKYLSRIFALSPIENANSGTPRTTNFY